MITFSRKNDAIIIQSDYHPLERTDIFLAVLSFIILISIIFVPDYYSNMTNPSYAKIFLLYFIVAHLLLFLYFYLSIRVSSPSQLELSMKSASSTILIGVIPVIVLIGFIVGQTTDPFIVAFLLTSCLTPIYLFLTIRKKSFMEITTHINLESYTIDTSLNLFGFKSHRSKTFDTDNLDIRVAVFKNPIYLFIPYKKDYKISIIQKMIEENSPELQGKKIFKLRFFNTTNEMTDQGELVKEDINWVAKTDSLDEIEKLIVLLLEIQSIDFR